MSHELTQSLQASKVQQPLIILCGKRQKYCDSKPKLHLASREVVVQGHGIGCVHEDLWHGGQVLYRLQFQAKEMSVNGLALDGLGTELKNIYIYI